MTRRDFLALAGVAFGISCANPTRPTAATSDGRLRARPGTPSSVADPGEHRLDLATGSRDGLLYVPPSCAARPAPLVVMLHGAGGVAADVDFTYPFADQYGIIILAPESRSRTWDAILGQFGPDVDFIDRALAQTFGRCAVDPGRLSMGGFSDGASYALGLGLVNGDLFTHVIAFSPGFIPEGERLGRPKVFISHGTNDGVLPVEASRTIVSRLQANGYDVTYREFAGGHQVPPDITHAAFEWFMN